MVNRLTSSLDESLVNLTLLNQESQMERERALYKLEEVFLEFRRLIEKIYHQYEYEIKYSYRNYDQHIYELKSHLKQVREELIKNFTTNDDNIDNDDYLFDINKYHYLEMLTTQTLNQTMKEQKILPKYHIKLNNLDQLEQFFSIQFEQKPSKINISQTDNHRLSREITPIQRCLSTGEEKKKTLFLFVIDILNFIFIYLGFFLL